MKYLLDTHTFLWAAFSPQKLPQKSKRIILDPRVEVAVSVVTFWEISLKYALGKITLAKVLPDDLPQVAEQMGLETAGLDPKTVASFYKLPRPAHKDPFDRLLIWQSINNGYVLITKDESFSAYTKYGLKIVW